MEQIHEIQIGLEELAKRALESGTISGLAALRRVPESEKISFTLIRDAGDVDGLCPFLPWMPANAARSVSEMTRETAFSEPVAVILRPCELRALHELAKLKQAKLENLLLISFECAGVYPYATRLDAEGDRVEAYGKAAEAGENCPEIRPVCAACEEFLPRQADVVFSLIGRATDGHLYASFPTDKGKEFAEALKLLEGASEAQAKEERDRLAEARRGQREAMADRIRGSLRDVDGLLSIFDRCISCHACRYVCPICYCKDCFFESPTFQYTPSSISRRFEAKEILRLPMDRILFHLGRLAHMGASCVACGMCEDVCVAGIPVSQIFKTVGGDIQEMFDYLPGKHIEEPLPLLTYREDELKEMED